MYYLPAQNAAASKITVTATATLLYDLINTAGSTALPRAGYPVDTNSLEIRLESGGSVRVFFEGNTPTSTNGWLLQEGETWRFCGTNLDKLRLIRVTNNVTCSVQLGKADRSESGVYMIAGTNGFDVNITELGGNAIDLNTGVVGLGTQRVTLATDVLLPAYVARTNSVSTTAQAGRVVKASSGNLRAVSMTNANASTRFLQVHNATSEPIDGSVPIASIAVPSGTTQSIDYGLDGRTMSIGIYVCASSTQNTKTIAGSDHLFDAQYT